jgi:hypothetical protein
MQVVFINNKTMKSTYRMIAVVKEPPLIDKGDQQNYHRAMDRLNVGTPSVSGGSPSVLSSTMGSSSAVSGQAARKAAAQKQKSRLAHRVTMAVPVDISGFASQNFQPSVCTSQTLLEAIITHFKFRSAV